ncbi:MAG: ANTAR domain-containing protein [Nocardioides sp.]|nr:ANTAR domain-containing protein [Nocardioides sp.]
MPTDPRFEANPALVEQARGALMLHYGIDSHQALAVLIGWARTSRTHVPTIAHTLLSGICEGNPQTEVRQPTLMRWIEAQLRDAAVPLRTGT